MLVHDTCTKKQEGRHDWLCRQEPPARRGDHITYDLHMRVLSKRSLSKGAFVGIDA